MELFSKVYQDNTSVRSRSANLLSAILSDAVLFRKRWQEALEHPLSQSNSRAYRRNPFAPNASYGRHRGPAPSSSHAAAVLIALLPSSCPTDPQNHWTIPLTLRPANLSDHAGQVSFPGGRCEPGESEQQAALREYSEELGCSTDRVELIGSLPELYVYASRHRVAPVLGLGLELPVMNPSAQEVEKVLLLDLKLLLSLQPTLRSIQRGGMQLETRGFWLEGHWVWGATAMMLGELKQRLDAIAHIDR